jgi:hypothetical protein
MKTEWMYFIVGAGLMAAVMSFTMNGSNNINCEAVAEVTMQPIRNAKSNFIAKFDPKGLSDIEKMIAWDMYTNRNPPSSSTDAYMRCLEVKNASSTA